MELYEEMMGGRTIKIHISRRWFKVYGYCPGLGIEVVGRFYGKVWMDLTDKIRDRLDAEPLTV